MSEDDIKLEPIELDGLDDLEELDDLGGLEDLGELEELEELVEIIDSRPASLPVDLPEIRIDGVETFTLGMEDLLNSDLETLEANLLDEEELDEGDRGTNEYTPKETLEKVLISASTRIEILMKNPGVARTNEKELEKSTSFLQNVKGVDFLTEKDKSLIYLSVSQGQDTNDILTTILNLVPTSKYNSYQLSLYIEGVRSLYKKAKKSFEMRAQIKKQLAHLVLVTLLDEIHSDCTKSAAYENSDKICYIKQPKVGTAGTSYECGNCGKHCVPERPLVHYLVPSIEFKLTKVGGLQTLYPSYLVCDNCDYLNIFTFKEYTILSTLVDSKTPRKLIEWESIKSTTNRGLSLAYYDLGVILARDTSVIKEDNVDISNWVEPEYRIETNLESDMQHFLLKHEQTMESIKNISKTLNLTSGFVEIDGKLIIDPYKKAKAVSYLSRRLSDLLKEDYAELKRNSYLSCLKWFKDTNLHEILSEKSVFVQESLMYQEDYLDIKEFESNKFMLAVYSDIAGRLGVTDLNISNLVVDETLNHEYKKVVDGVLREKFRNLKDSIEESKEYLRGLKQSLNYSIDLLRVLPIRSVNRLEYEELEFFLTDPDTEKLLDYVSDLMILNHLSKGNYLKYWGTIRGGVLHKGYLTKGLEEAEKAVPKFLKDYSKFFKDKKIPAPNLYKDFIKYFVSGHRLQPNILKNVLGIKNALKSRDYLMLLKHLLDIYDISFGECDKFFGMIQLKKQLTKDILDLENILNKSEMSFNMMYLIHHFGDLFSVDEIVESPGVDFIKQRPPFRYVRKDGETFNSYMYRLYNTEDGEVLLNIDNDKIEPLLVYLPSIIAISEFFSYLGSLKSSSLADLLINDLFTTAFMFGKDPMSILLGIPERSEVNDFKFSVSSVYNFEKKDLRALTIFENIFFLNPELRAEQSEDPLHIYTQYRMDLLEFIDKLDGLPKLSEDLKGNV